jgi:hypothetical protein
MLFGLLAFVPATAAAQELPTDRLPTDQQVVAPEDQPAAVGACGAEGSTIIDRQPLGLAPTDPQNVNKGLAGENPANLMAVRGTILHAEGNLVLVKLPDSPSLGTTTPAGQPRPNLMAVVRLPAECVPGALPEGSGLLAVGTATAEGILNAQSVQPTAE